MEPTRSRNSVRLDHRGLGVDEREDGASGMPPTAVASSDEAAPEEQSYDAANESASEGEGESEGEERFWLTLRERLISWRTMRPSLRLITGVAVAQLLAAGAIIALHGLTLPQINLGLSFGHATQMAAPFFWASIAFTVISLAFLMTAALMMRWPIRLLALALFSWLTLFTPEPDAYSAFRLAMVALLWLWTGAVALALGDSAEADASAGGSLGRLKSRAQRWVRAVRARFPGAIGAPLPVATLTFMLLWQVALYTALLASTGWMQYSSNDIFQLTIGVQLASLTGALIPFLFLAGSDFAELGELIAAGVARGLAGARVTRSSLANLVTLAAAALALYTAVTYAPSAGKGFSQYGWAYLGELAMGVVIFLALAGLLRWGSAVSWPSARLSAFTLLFVSLGYFGLMTLSITVLIPPSSASTSVTISDFSVYQAPAGQPTFSMPYPAGWKVRQPKTSGGSTSLIFDGLNQTFSGAAFVEIQADAGASDATAAAAMDAYLASAEASQQVTNVGAHGTDGPWQTVQFTDHLSAGRTFACQVWSRGENGYDVILIGLAVPAYKDTLFPAFESMAQGWRPDLSAHAPIFAETSDHAAARRAAAIALGLAPLALGLIVGLWLVRRRRAGHTAWPVAGVFIATFGLLTGAQMLPLMLQVAGASKTATWFLGLPIENMLQVAALGIVALCAYVIVWRRNNVFWLAVVRLALALNIGLLFIVWMSNLYDRAISASQSSAHHAISWAEALIVLIALGWDLLMSGETFTNRDDKAMPRHTRLLLYLGYILLTATLVVYFSAQSYTYAAGAHEAFFESEPWPQMGLQTLGPAMVVTTFALGVTTLLRRKRQSERHSNAHAQLSGAGSAVAEAPSEG